MGWPSAARVLSGGLRTTAATPRISGLFPIRTRRSVWDTVEALERFVYQTVHKRFYGRREEWFDKLDGPHSVMWWVPVGHRPGLIEAKERLEHLAAHGPSEFAFDWAGVPAAQLWKTARCASGGQAA
jgi:hypothetical protein